MLRVYGPSFKLPSKVLGKKNVPEYKYMHINYNLNQLTVIISINTESSLAHQFVEFLKIYFVCILFKCVISL